MMPRDTMAGEAPGRSTAVLSRAMVPWSISPSVIVPITSIQTTHASLGTLRSRRGLQVARHRVSEGPSATTFATPLGPKDLDFEGRSLFTGKPEIVARSAATNALAGDSAADREGARTGATGDGEGHRKASSSSRREMRQIGPSGQIAAQKFARRALGASLAEWGQQSRS